MIDECIPMQNTVGREISKSEVVGAIQYIQYLDGNITQKRIAEILGCHATKHKDFVHLFHDFSKNIDCV